MNNKNDPEAAIGYMIFAAIAMAAIFLFFLAGVASLALTIMCILAWNEERRFFGQTITPSEAHNFVGFGIAGAVLVGLFGSWMYDQGMLEAENRPWMPVVGYVLGSLGWGICYGYNQQAEEKLAREAAQHSPIDVTPRAKQQHAEPQKVEREFEFASWDDERPPL